MPHESFDARIFSGEEDIVQRPVEQFVTGINEKIYRNAFRCICKKDQILHFLE